MRNKYPGTCYYCGGHVPAGEGHFERDRINRNWKTIHAQCVFKQRAEKQAMRRTNHES